MLRSVSQDSTRTYEKIRMRTETGYGDVITVMERMESFVLRMLANQLMRHVDREVELTSILMLEEEQTSARMTLGCVTHDIV